MSYLLGSEGFDSSRPTPWMLLIDTIYCLVSVVWLFILRAFSDDLLQAENLLSAKLLDNLMRDDALVD